MEVKDLFDPLVKQEIIDRVNKLTSESQRLRGKMDVSQMKEQWSKGTWKHLDYHLQQFGV